MPLAGKTGSEEFAVGLGYSSVFAEGKNGGFEAGLARKIWLRG